MYYYWGFGLTIKSEIEFPEFLEQQFRENSDIEIRLGEVPLKISGEDIVNRVNVSISATEYLQKMPVASYYVSNGKEILIQVNDHADLKSVRLFLLSNAMAALLHQRNSIPMHASAIYHENGIVLFCGHSGVGKSTIITALQLKGYKVFSDDVCVLVNAENDAKEIFAYPSYPMIKLWVDAYSKMALGEVHEGDKIRPELAKYSRFFHNDLGIDALPIKKVFILDQNNMLSSIKIERLTSFIGFRKLQQNSYRHVQMNSMKKRNFHFSIISKLAGLVPVYSLSRPMNENTIDEIIRIIESKISENE